VTATSLTVGPQRRQQTRDQPLAHRLVQNRRKNTADHAGRVGGTRHVDLVLEPVEIRYAILQRDSSTTLREHSDRANLRKLGQILVAQTHGVLFAHLRYPGELHLHPELLVVGGCARVPHYPRVVLHHEAELRVERQVGGHDPVGLEILQLVGVGVGVLESVLAGAAAHAVHHLLVSGQIGSHREHPTRGDVRDFVDEEVVAGVDRDQALEQNRDEDVVGSLGTCGHLQSAVAYLEVRREAPAKDPRLLLAAHERLLPPLRKPCRKT
jgi:hypothetical protein